MAERLMNMVRSFGGSILDIWPTPPKLEEFSPHDATEMVRESWEEAGQALWDAMGAIGIDTEEEEAEAESTEDDRCGRHENGSQ